MGMTAEIRKELRDYLTGRGFPQKDNVPDMILVANYRQATAAHKAESNPEVQALIKSGGSGTVNRVIGDTDVHIENGRIVGTTTGGIWKPILAAAAVAGTGGLAAYMAGGAAAGGAGGAGAGGAGAGLVGTGEATVASSALPGTIGAAVPSSLAGGGTAAGVGGTAATGASTISQISRIAKAGKTASDLGGSISDAGNAAGNNRRNDATIGQSAQRTYESALMDRAALEKDQRKEAQKDLYRSQFARTRQTGPYNPKPLPAFTPEYLEGMSALEKQALARLKKDPMYESTQLTPLTERDIAEAGGAEKTASWLGPTLSTIGTVAGYF